MLLYIHHPLRLQAVSAGWDKKKSKKNLKKDFSRTIVEEINLKKTATLKPKVYKVAILAGLVLFGAAGSYQFYEPVKDKIQKTMHKEENTKHLPLKNFEKLQKNLFYTP